jgi:hypothetical protein
VSWAGAIPVAGTAPALISAALTALAAFVARAR